MTMNTLQTGGTNNANIPLGAKLQSAREAQRLDRKDAAAKLRLNENVIHMIENDSFPDSMPTIFVRGYIRAYGKLLQLPDDVIAAGLEPLKPAPAQDPQQPATAIGNIDLNSDLGKYIIRGTTAAVILTLFTLVVVWWFGHSTTAPTPENISMTLPETPAAAVAVPASIGAVAPAPANPSRATTIPYRANSMIAAPLTKSAPEANMATAASDRATDQNTAQDESHAKSKPYKASAAIPAYKRAEQATETNNPNANETEDE